MGRSTWSAALRGQHGAGTLFNSYTTAKTVINDAAAGLLDPDFFYEGKSLEIKVRGAISNIVTTPGTMNFQVKLGTKASPITVFDTGSVQLNATAHTTLPFWLDILLTCRTIGATTAATLMGLARLTGVMFTKTAGQTDNANSETVINLPVTGPAVGGGFDSTIQNYMDLWAGFSISNAGNGVRIDQYLPISHDIAA